MVLPGLDMDDIDRRILTAVQARLPVAERPYDALADGLGLDAAEVLARLRRMQEDGLLRRLGPVFDSRALGYVSTLVAARVPPDRLDDAAARVSRLPGVTHNYERRHVWNLWFTLTSPSAAEQDRVLDVLRRETGAADLRALPALAVYKIRVQFDLDDEDAAAARASEGGPAPAPGADAERTAARGAPAPPPAPDARARDLVRRLQDGLAVVPEPFREVAAATGRPVADVLAQVRAWIGAGVIRRFGAVVRHQRLGYTANGMAVFRVDEGRVDEAGRRLAGRAAVSHCYRRPPLPDFPYNLYAMVHGRSEEAVRGEAEAMAREAAADAHDVLFSVREFKKASMRYFVEEA